MTDYYQIEVRLTYSKKQNYNFVFWFLVKLKTRALFLIVWRYVGSEYYK